ncbi:MAG: WG repeat-containing protein [Candidatus Hydrogenedentes bacterium]|nr:WG repeat-containing protein [Candidatus Hydrogenedentota bacterium]
MNIRNRVIVICLVAGLGLGGLWIYQTAGNLERNAHVVLYPDGTPVPESELAWVATLADALAREAGDPWLRERVDQAGVRGAYSTLHHEGAVRGVVFGVHLTTTPVFPITTPSGTYYVNRDGDLLLRPPNDFHVPQPFHEGLAAVGSISPDGVSGGPSFRYINENGDTAIPGPFASALPFSGGVAVASAVTGDGTVRYGAIDRAGAWLIEPKFNSLFEFSDGLAAAQIDNPDHSARIAGFIDPTGEFVVTLDKVQRMKSSHRGGLALVWRTEPPYYIFVDRGGNTVLTPDYDQVEPFHEGRAAVMAGDRWGFIDTEGNEAIPPQYPWLPPPFDNGMVALIQTPHWANTLARFKAEQFELEYEEGDVSAEDTVFKIVFTDEKGNVIDGD